MLPGLVCLELGKLIYQNKLDDPPGLEEVNLRCFQVTFDQIVNAFAP